MDLVRSVLNRFLFITIQGMTFPTWARMLWENHFLVHPVYWPRALILTVTSLLNALYAALDAAFRLAGPSGPRQSRRRSSSGTSGAERRTCTTCSPSTGRLHTQRSTKR